MFPNLKAEMARRSITALKLSELCGINNATLNGKLNGKIGITLKEAISIKKALGIDMDLEDLFEEKSE